MNVYDGKDLHNVGLVGHGHSGKTSLVAACLFTAGMTKRLTRVDEGNTVTDHDDEEIARKVTISTSLAFMEWHRTKINLIDTPGYNIFLNDTKAALAAAGTELVLVDALAGVEVQTEKVWAFGEEYDLPRIIVVNKLDKERADFYQVVENIRDVLGKAAFPAQIPIGTEDNFRGVVDLISGQAYEFERDGDGRGKPCEMPADMADLFEENRTMITEAVAESDEELLEEYLENLELPPEKVLQGLRKGIAERKIFPIVCMSAFHNIGTSTLLDFMEEHVPPPTVRGIHAGVDDDGNRIERDYKNDEPTSVFVYKTVSDPFSGQISYFKVMSGVVKNDDHLWNYDTETDERFSRFGLAFGKEVRPVAELRAGDLGAVAKLKSTHTWNTLGVKSNPIHYPKPNIPEPAISYAIQPKSRNDEDKLGTSIHRILEEEPWLKFYRDPQTHDFLLGGSGQQQLEVVVNKLKKRYNVEVDLKEPKIPYRETIRGHADAHGRHKKQSGGHGQFGDCKIKMSPLERGAGFEFSNDIFGGAIPKGFIPAVEKGILDAAAKGYLAGFPVVDFKVSLYDGQYHDVDSNEMSFKMAGRKAFRVAMEQAKPALLEPVMKVEVVAPTDYAGDLMGDLNSRRGRIQGMDTKGSNQTVKAEVPMSEMLTYANDLTSMTQGRGSFHMEFDHYDYVPQQAAEKIIAAAARGDDDEDE